MLELFELRKSFGPQVAVDGLSLAITRGEVLGLLGPNGAGKTTTISMAVGLLTPDGGTITLEGHGSPTDPEARRAIGVAPQALALYDELTAWENLDFFGRLYGLTGAERRTRARDLLAITGLEERRRSRVGTFSGGMKRRLNLAVALMHDPPLLLMDEPTAGVDPQSRNAIFEIVETQREQGRTVVYTTHYMEEAARLCDRVAIIDHGRLLALDTVDELIALHGGPSTLTVERRQAGAGVTREESATQDPIGELESQLQRGDVVGLRLDRPDLEAVFLSLTGRSLRDQ